MSSVIFRIIAEEGEDPANPGLTIMTDGDIKHTMKVDLNTLFGEKMNEFDQGQFMLQFLRLAAMGKNKKNFLQLLRRKNGICINC